MKLFVDQLTNIDFSYLHPSRGLVGESWLVSILLEGTPDLKGMLWDFGLLKKKLRTWLDTQIDHRLLVPTGLQQLHWTQNKNTATLKWHYPEGGELYCQTPTDSMTFIQADQINENTLASYVEQHLSNCLPEMVRHLKLNFYPHTAEGAYYHYSHGLKHHKGNCQRIAHGHRSPIKIWRNQTRDINLEQAWANRWQDVYLGSEKDLHCQYDHADQAHHHYQYQAQQGIFTLKLPAKHCYLLPSHTTVECIATHIACKLKMQFPEESFKVQAYEGILKGAISES